MELFRLFGSVLLKGGEETEKQLDNIDKKGSKAGQKLAKAGKTVAKAGTVMSTAARVAGVTVFSMATKASQTADRVDKLSQKIGISRTAFQEWDFIASQTGTNVEVLQTGIKTLSNAAFEASEGTKEYAGAFKELGVEVKNTDGSLKSQEQLLNETIAALSGMEDQTKRSALASKLMGKSATELSPLLNSGTQALDDMKKKAHDLGLVLSDEAVDSGVQFTDTMDQLNRTVGGLFTKALAPLLPTINDLAKQFTNILPSLMGFIQPLIEKLIPVVERLITTMLPVFIKLLDAFMPVLDPLIELFLMLVDTVLIPLIELLLPIIEAIMPIFIELLSAIIPVLEPLLELFFTLINKVLPIFIEIFNFVSDIILKNFSGALNDLIPVFESVMKAIGHLLDFWLAIFSGDWTEAWDSLKSYFSEIWNGIERYFKYFINNVIRGLNLLIRGLNKISFNIPDWVPGIGGRNFGINIREIPLLANGGNIMRSGAAIVGEAGPELLHLPQNARVSPLTSSDKEFIDYDKLGKAVVKAIMPAIESVSTGDTNISGLVIADKYGLTKLERLLRPIRENEDIRRSGVVGT